ncbi:MAG TPA: AsmA-like C-terminal domain-containing protein [Smithellaceae bacterium]|nr:AsmA-like C-terminal domain-containing protein [Smithellaceae bacterium]
MKKMTRKKIVILAIIAFLSVSAAGGVATVLYTLSNLDARKGEIVAFLNKTLNREVSYENQDFSFWFGPTFTFRGIEIKERNGKDTFAAIERLSFKVAVLPLLTGKIVIKKMQFDKPSCSLYRDSSGVLNISDLLESQKPPSIEIRRMVINDGALTFTDHHVIPSGWTIRLSDIDFGIRKPIFGRATDLNFLAALDQKGKKGILSVNGSIRFPGKNESLANSHVNARIIATGLSINQYGPYWKKVLPFRKAAGGLNIDVRIKGDAHRFSSEGSVAVKNLHLEYPQVFHASLTPKDASLNYALQRTPSEIIMEKMALVVDDLKISGSAAIRDIDKKDPLITAKASSSRVSLEKLGPFVPYGIIAEGVADFIKTNIRGGKYQLKEGSIHGRISQLAHMGENENCKVLHVKVGVDEGIVSYDKNIPVISGIRGELEFLGRDMFLHHMTGKFGESPVALEGRITGYCMSGPSGYPFTLTMNPGQKEVAWLLGIDAGSNFVFTGKTFLRMTGSGTTDHYSLDGDWELTDATYNYKNVFTKQPSQKNQVAFKSSFRSGEWQVEAFSFWLASLRINAAAKYGFKDKVISHFAVESNPFQMEHLLSNLPQMGKYQPVGSMQFALTGSGTAESIADLDLQGNVTFSGVSFRPIETFSPISVLKGSVSIGKNRLDTSLLTGRIGKSPVQGRASLQNFSNPSVSINVSSDLLNLEDVGLISPSGAIKLKNFTGDFVFRDNKLLVNRLSAGLNHSVFHVTGNMPDVKKPFFDIRVTAPFLDTDDIILLSGLNARPKKESASDEELSLKASVHAHRGKIYSIPCSELSTVLTYRQRALDVPAWDMNAFDGAFSGKGQIVFPKDGAAKYNMNFMISKMSAEQILKHAGFERVSITGTLTMKGDLTAEGEALSDLKKTARGTATVLMEKGSLNKFAVLSKVFSILNVSQLLKFQLPDMVTVGMPFTSINGKFFLEDGILSSDDLFIKSDSMNISVVGTTDILREELNHNIGIQPLQTVDKIVSYVPVAGWILTDDKRRLLTLYFHAQGKWSDPVVKAIPFKSMSKGLQDIYKNLFHLPSKLITDTGEVLIGR